jgi:NitT/TauT family transport system substrate-binding protein
MEVFMRKRKLCIFSILMTVLLVCTVFSGCSSKGTTSSSTQALTKVRLNEVARSVFYAPFYAAMNQGYFKDQGLDIDLTTGQGADKTMQQVLSKSDDIGFCGPEQVIYINNKGRDDYPVIFGQLTETDGSFLVGRAAEPNFSWSNLKGKTIIGGRPGGIPEMALEFALKKNGLNPAKDVNLVTNIEYTATAGAFKSGTGDYVALFEPSGSMLEQAKAGSIVASVGAAVGAIPETCYFTSKSYMDKNPEILQKFMNAIYKGQLWVQKHSDDEVAAQIKSFFPGTNVSILTSVVKNYRAIKAYKSDPVLSESDLTRFMDVIESYNKTLIPQRPAYSKIVNNTFSEKAIQNVK